VLGSTPAADAARFLAARLRIRLADGPEEAPVVLVATQGQGDEEALERALRSPAQHVLMIASRRKADRLREVMRMRGIDEARLAHLAAPAGPDAGAKTPGEIALVAIVGVLSILRGKAEETTAQDLPRAGAAVPDSPLGASRNEAAGAPSGAKFVNPVCGTAVDTTAAKHVERYDGVDYYFCCDGCWTAFREAPAKFAAIHRATFVRAHS
jgi:xanthine dehydrogenase accessory factor